MTDEQTIVLTLDWSEQTAERLYLHLRTLLRERDQYLQQWSSALGQETPVPRAHSHGGIASAAAGGGVESNHLAVELADWKARLRKQRQEL